MVPTRLTLDVLIRLMAVFSLLPEMFVPLPLRLGRCDVSIDREGSICLCLVVMAPSGAATLTMVDSAGVKATEVVANPFSEI